MNFILCCKINWFFPISMHLCITLRPICYLFDLKNITNTVTIYILYPSAAGQNMKKYVLCRYFVFDSIYQFFWLFILPASKPSPLPTLVPTQILSRDMDLSFGLVSHDCSQDHPGLSWPWPGTDFCVWKYSSHENLPNLPEKIPFSFIPPDADLGKFRGLIPILRAEYFTGWNWNQGLLPRRGGGIWGKVWGKVSSVHRHLKAQWRVRETGFA